MLALNTLISWLRNTQEGKFQTLGSQMWTQILCLSYAVWWVKCLDSALVPQQQHLSWTEDWMAGAQWGPLHSGQPPVPPDHYDPEVEAQSMPQPCKWRAGIHSVNFHSKSKAHWGGMEGLDVAVLSKEEQAAAFQGGRWWGHHRTFSLSKQLLLLWIM